MINPCCGSSLQRGVKIMATIDILIEVVSLALFIISLVNVFGLNDTSSKNVGAVSVIITIILSIMSTLLAVRLWFGADKRDLKNCRIWFIVTCIIVCLNIVIAVINISAGEASGQDISAFSVNTLYRIYMIWVVYAFMDELKNNVNPNPTDGIVYTHPSNARMQQEI